MVLCVTSFISFSVLSSPSMFLDNITFMELIAIIWERARLVVRVDCTAIVCHFVILDISHFGFSAVAWWLMPRTPDPEVGGSSPTRVKPCVSLSKSHKILLPKSTGNTQEAVAPSQHD